MNLGKIPTSKSLLNLLVQISKAIVNSKILFYLRKEFPLAFGPIGPAASWLIRPFGPAGLAGLLLPPPTPKQSMQATTADRPRAAPWSAPTTSTEGKKSQRHPSFISPLNGCPLPSSILQ
jgi:hypothetical protein